MEFDITTQSEEAVIIGEGSFKNKRAKITEKNTPYIFSLLSKIYSDRTGSVVREITSNCFDAHVKAAKILRKQAEELLLRNGDLEEVDLLLTKADEQENEPVFIRKYIDEQGRPHMEFVDVGTGLSEQLMDDIYMSYGESDKRESNDYLGAFGLGSKSPFSYSDHFTVITRVNGIQYTYLLFETPMGPEYDCLDQCETDQRNGTIIRIPIKGDEKDEKPGHQVSLWESSIKTQLKYFTNVFILNFPGISNDYKIKEFKNFKLRNDTFKSNPSSPLHISLGDVAYPIRFDKLPSLEGRVIGFNAALKFNIGSLEITPSREEVLYTESNIKIIESKIEEFEAELLELLTQDELMVFDSLLEYRETRYKLSKEDIIVNKFFIDEEIILRLDRINIQFKDHILSKISFKLNGVRLSVDTAKLNPKSFVTPILMRGDIYNDYKLCKWSPTIGSGYSERRREVLGEVFFKGEKIKHGYVIIPESTVKLKNYERQFLNENVKPSRVIKFKTSAFVKHVFKNLTFFQDGGLKSFTLTEVKDLIKEFWSKYERDILIGNFQTLKSLNIPEDYGKVKGPSVRKEDETILFYTVTKLGGLERTERKVEYLQKHYKSTYIFTDNANYEELTVYRRAFYDSVKRESLVTFLVSAKKYHETLKTLPNFFSLEDLRQEKEKSKLYQIKTIRDFILKGYRKELFHKVKDLFNLEFKDLSNFSTPLNVESSLLTNFKQVLKSCNDRLDKETRKVNLTVNSITYSKLRVFFSEEYSKNLKDKLEIRMSEYKSIMELKKTIEKDFYLELYLISNEFSLSTLQLESLNESLKLKSSKVKKYYIQTKTNK